jgi:hypothetical protein
MTPIENKRSMEIVEDALRTLPPAPVPGTLRSRVMFRVRLLAGAPKFAFPWLEAAFSLMMSTLLTGLTYVVLGLPPSAWMRLTHSIRHFFILPANQPIIIAALAVAGILALCVLSAARLFVIPLRMPAPHRR